MMGKLLICVQKCLTHGSLVSMATAISLPSDISQQHAKVSIQNILSWCTRSMLIWLNLNTEQQWHLAKFRDKAYLYTNKQTPVRCVILYSTLTSTTLGAFVAFENYVLCYYTFHQTTLLFIIHFTLIHMIWSTVTWQWHMTVLNDSPLQLSFHYGVVDPEIFGRVEAAWMNAIKC